MTSSLMLASHPMLDASQPTFIEMFTEERLLQGLIGALKHAFNVFAERSVWLARAYPYADYILLALAVFLEKHYLTYYDATFAEHFYMLRRVNNASQGEAFTSDKPVSGVQGLSNLGSGRLTPRQRWVSLFSAVILPWLKQRCDEMYEDDLRRSVAISIGLSQVSTSEDDINVGQPAGHSTRRFLTSIYHRYRRSLTSVITYCIPFLRRIYPYFHLCYEGSSWVYMFLYAFNRSRYFSPISHLFQILVRRMTMAEIMASASVDKVLSVGDPTTHTSPTNLFSPQIHAFDASLRLLFSPPSPSPSLLSHLSHHIGTIWTSVLDSARFVLVFSILGYKFLEWWYSPEAERPRMRPRFSIPPPNPLSPPQPSHAPMPLV